MSLGYIFLFSGAQFIIAHTRSQIITQGCVQSTILLPCNCPSLNTDTHELVTNLRWKKPRGSKGLCQPRPEARVTRVLQLTVDGAGAEVHTSACYHCRRNLLPLLQKSALECPRIPRAWVWASVALEPSSEDYLKDNFSSQPNVSTEILYPFFFFCGRDVCELVIQMYADF